MTKQEAELSSAVCEEIMNHPSMESVPIHSISSGWHYGINRIPGSHLYVSCVDQNINVQITTTKSELIVDHFFDLKDRDCFHDARLFIVDGIIQLYKSAAEKGDTFRRHQMKAALDRIEGIWIVMNGEGSDV